MQKYGKDYRIIEFSAATRQGVDELLTAVIEEISKLPPKPVINLGEYPRTSDFTPIVPITSEPTMKPVIPIIPPKAPKTTGGNKWF